MRQPRLNLFFLTAILAATFGVLQGCGGSRSLQKSGADSVAAARADSLRRDSLANADTARRVTTYDSTANLDDLDYVRPTTDERINVMSAVRRGLSAGGFGMQTFTESGLGCQYPMPAEWANTRRDYRNVVNYFGNNKISVIISVGRTTFDSLYLWAQIQEALAYGKNQVPKGDIKGDTALITKGSAQQIYFGRYELAGKQVNTAYFKRGDNQFNIVVEHPTSPALTQGEAEAINFIMASFIAGDPTIEIPKPLTNYYPEVPPEAPEPKGKKGKKGKKSATKKTGTKPSAKAKKPVAKKTS